MHLGIFIVQFNLKVMKKTLESSGQPGQDRNQMKKPAPENPTRKPIPEKPYPDKKNETKSMPDEVNVKKTKPTIPEIHSQDQRSREQQKTTSRTPAQNEELEEEPTEHNPKTNVW
jgi:hypothetical protein